MIHQQLRSYLTLLSHHGGKKPNLIPLRPQGFPHEQLLELG